MGLKQPKIKSLGLKTNENWTWAEKISKIEQQVERAWLINLPLYQTWGLEILMSETA